MKYGLNDRQFTEIISILSRYPEIEEAVLFGSRAIDTFKEASDIDIALKGKLVTASLAAKIKYYFEEETYLPFFFDIIAYPAITNEELIKHIDTKGISIFKAGWRECKLEDLIKDNLADLQTGPFGTMLKASEYTANGTPMIAVQDIGENKLHHEKVNYVPQSVAERLSRYKVKVNDIIFGRKGAVDRRAIITKNEDGWIQGSDCIRLRLHEDNDSRFISYQLGGSRIKEWLNQHSHGATMPSLNQEILSLLPLTLPSLIEQQVISSVLSSLDDKIDLLHKQNKTLEAMAETLFRQWFGPPDPLKGEEEGWVENFDGTLAEYVKVQAGYAFKSPDFKETGNNAIIKITNISMGSVDIVNTQFVDDVIVENIDSSKFQIAGGDFLIAMTGAEIGKIGIVEKTDKLLWLNQRVGKLIPNIKYGEYIGYLALRSPEGQDHIINACSGSAQENISSVKIEEMKLVSYSKDKTALFGKEVKPFFDKIIFNHSQIRTLEKMRDTLLPKLMSGELRVER